MNKEKAKEKIAELVKKYEKLSQSEIKAYHEAKTKQGFIEPLFRALGWNFEDTNEVAPEEKASGGRVDYAFKLNGVSRFYIEAKALRVDLTREEYIKQAITYAYTKGVTWAVLTDFEGIQVYNAETGNRFLNLTYDKYLTTEFEDLWLLSKESFQINALNEKAEKYGALPVRLGIEQRLFNQLRQWREELSTQLHSYNKNLSIKQIDEVIQRLFNRLIFIRTCEDRGIEDKILRGTVHEWVRNKRKGELIKIIQSIFRDFDGFYDSELFQGHLTDEVDVESNTIENLINGLYEVPGGMASYDFSIIDADVLGAVYEQYLGYVAKVVKQKAKDAQAKMDLGLPYDETIELTAKKLRRKEHGIYYTPKFITDYIVKETVGRFLAECSANEIRNIKILDPACGSGSFLIRAFDELLKHYAKQKISKSEQDIDAADRISILQSNIFGVDLDIQAVEIARLNLLLRSLAKRETLPGLADNIKKGNSLISGAEKELKKYFGNSWQDKEPFNWEQEFLDIMDNGGFDVVIGNPPYVRIQSLPRDEADYYRDYYESAFGSFDIYVMFIEKAINLLKPNGRLGFITSGKFLKAEYGKKLREVIRSSCKVESIIDLSAQKVFGEATTYPAILIIRKGSKDSMLNYTFIPDGIDLMNKPLANISTIVTDQAAITKGIWPPISDENPVMKKLQRESRWLNEVTDRIFQGLKTSADKVFVLKLIREQDDEVVVFSDSLNKQVRLESRLVKPLIKTGQMERYHIQKPTKIILFPYIAGELVPDKNLETRYPLTWKYLLENKKYLLEREHGAFAGLKWYQYGRNQAIQTIDLPKIITPDFAPSARFSLDENGVYFFSGGTAGGYGIIPSKNTNTLYLLGLLNSRLLDWYLHSISSNFQGGYFSYESRYIKKLPIRQINFNNPSEKRIHDRLVTLVKKTLELNKKFAPLRDLPLGEHDDIEMEIKRTDKEIDNLVYDLYGLTEEERKIVEGT